MQETATQTPKPAAPETQAPAPTRRDFEAGARIAGIQRRHDRVVNHQRWWRGGAIAVVVVAMLLAIVVVVVAIGHRDNAAIYISSMSIALTCTVAIWNLSPRTDPDTEKEPTPDELAALVGYVTLIGENGHWHITQRGRQAHAAYLAHTDERATS
jgi:hypothetical protein